MHPAMMYWWKSRRAAAGCGPGGEEAGAGCGPGAGGGGWRGWGRRGGHEEGHDDGGRWAGGGDDDGGFGGGAFGVRRPLRFLAYKLDLDERQVAELAAILDELKTERAQAEVDRRRTLSAFADAVGAAAFDEAKAGDAASLRVKSAERLRDAVTAALRRIHALLEDDQRSRLAYLIRTGTLSL
jgi:Spy/CpxP family protein refolding chaperone